MNEGEDLVVEPFQRLIEADQLVAYQHTSFFRSMDTLRDQQILEEMVEQGSMPWRVHNGAKAQSQAVDRRAMRPLDLAGPDEKLSVLCLGAHADDIRDRRRRHGSQLDRIGGAGSKSIGAC